MTVTKADLKQLAGQLRLAGELLEANGEKAWTTMDGWDDGPAAANTDPGGGNRVDDDDIPITINDPTGDAAVATLTVEAEPATLMLVRLLTDLSDDSGMLIDLLRLATPHMPQADKQQLLEAGLIEDGWCTSCYRDGKHLEPISLKADSTPYYRGLCKWCGEFKAKNRQLPPIVILRARHEGRRISDALVQRALGKKRKKKSRR